MVAGTYITEALEEQPVQSRVSPPSYLRAANEEVAIISPASR